MDKPAAPQPDARPPADPKAVFDRTVSYTDPNAAEAERDSFTFGPPVGSTEPTTEYVRYNDTPQPSSVGSIALNTADAGALLPPAGSKKASRAIVLGDFQVIEKLGQGGMGAVFKAKQISLDRDVALKVLARHYGDNREFVARFYREAQVMAKLAHPHIIHCYGVGEAHGLHYLAMEYVDGGSLQPWIEKLGKLSIGDAIHVTLALAYALEHAHEQKLVHRDIKPDNVLYNRKGVVKLADLGLAKPMGDDLSLTQSGVGAGTPHFMAPEQMRSAREVDGRADIYALGGMLYLMLTGQKPFRANSLLELIREKESGKYTPACQLNTEVPEPLEEILTKLLAVNPADRYQTCTDLLTDLEPLHLASPVLTFLDTDGKAPKSVKLKVPAGVAATPRKESKSTPPSSKLTAPTPDGDVWFVSTGSTPEGKRKVKRLTTAQVLEQLTTKTLDVAVEISRHSKSGYRAAAGYKEFEALCREVAARAAIKPKAKSDSEKTEEAEARGFWRKLFRG